MTLIKRALAFINTEKPLDLVERVCGRFGSNLLDVVIIGAQHLLPTTCRMISSWIEHGLRPANCFLLGKAYSSDLQSVACLSTLGCYVDSRSFLYSPDEGYDITYQRTIKHFIKDVCHNLKNRKPKRIVVFDDGGELIDAIMSSHLLLPQSAMVGIEQTTSGYRKLCRRSLSFPVINVARSFLKLDVESPMIAKTAQAAMLRLLGPSCARKHRALIVGYGAIGKAAHQVLVKNWDIDTLDSNTSHTALDSQHLCDSYDYVIGCTGNLILNGADLIGRKRPVTLISLSSSDREFQAASIRRLSCTSSYIHNNLSVGSVNLANSGFPVNFCGDTSITDPEEFQLTRALLTGALWQAMSCTHNRGFENLDCEIQSCIAQYLPSEASSSYDHDLSLSSPKIRPKSQLRSDALV